MYSRPASCLGSAVGAAQLVVKGQRCSHLADLWPVYYKYITHAYSGMRYNNDACWLSLLHAARGCVRRRPISRLYYYWLNLPISISIKLKVPMWLQVCLWTMYMREKHDNFTQPKETPFWFAQAHLTPNSLPTGHWSSNEGSVLLP